MEDSRSLCSNKTYIFLQVRWAEQLFSKSRVKRYAMPDPDEPLQRVKRLEETGSLKTINKDHRGKTWFNDELWSHEWYLVSFIIKKI